MSSRKNLKKLINNSMSILYSDCIFYKVFQLNSDVAKADKIIDGIAEVHADLLNRVSASEGKELKARTKLYYKKLKDDMKVQLDKFGKEIESLD